MARRIDRETFVLLGGTAALLLQVAHPLVAAGVDRHSDFRQDPVGRLRRTLDTTLAVVFGDDRDTARALARVNAIHSRVHGTAPAGRAYDARDPALLLWVQTTLVLTSLRLYELVMGRLPADDREAYWKEARPIARALGIPDARLPGSLAELEEWERAALERSAIPDELALAVGRDVLRPSRLLPAAVYWPNDALTAGLLPPRLRSAYGLRYGRAERFAFRAMIVAIRWLRRALPDLLTVVPQARRYERAARRRWPQRPPA